MKQEILRVEGKASSLQHPPVPPARSRMARTAAASTTKDGSRVESPNGMLLSPGSRTSLSASKASPKRPPPEANNGSRIRRPMFASKPKQGTENIVSPKEREVEDPKIVSKPRSRAIEQYARVRQHVDSNSKLSEYGQSDWKVEDDLQRRLHVSESLVKELQTEVLALKAQVESLQARNVYLESQSKQLGRDLSSAEAKIGALEKRGQVEDTSRETQPSEFKDVRELIANKLDLFPLKRGVTNANKPAKLHPMRAETGVKPVEIQEKVHPKIHPPGTVAVAGPPPPPPPPPPRTVPSRASTMQKPTALVELYHSITKRDAKKVHLGSENCASPGANSAHTSIVDELQNRSSHLLAIKADVEKKGDFVNHLIHKVQSSSFSDIEDVPAFVDWLDRQLSTLADERAVLKHFNWPEKKADALREAAFEYRDLKRLLDEVSSFEDDVSAPCEAVLKKTTTFLDKSERSIQRLIKLRNTAMHTYKDCNVPVAWMLDSGMVCKIKLASVKLAKIYIKRVSAELKLATHAERESSTQDALLLQGVRFAYRAYQFAGGLDSETMTLFEELRGRAQLVT